MNTIEQIKQIKQIIKPYVPDESKLADLTAETDFIKDLGINSANLVDIILDIEEQFGITIDNEGMEKMMTVKAALVIIENELSKK